jgi:hypothetical protein
MIKTPVGKLAPAEKEVHRLLAIADDVDLIGQIVLGQGVESQFQVVGIVFHQQNFNG